MSNIETLDKVIQTLSSLVNIVEGLSDGAARAELLGRIYDAIDEAETHSERISDE